MENRSTSKVTGNVHNNGTGNSKDNGIDKNARWWALIIGAGMAILPIHNRWLTELTTNSSGETILFIPTIGYILVLVGAGALLLNHWGEVRRIQINYKIFIPLIIIAVCISVSGIAADTIETKLAHLSMAISFVGIYLSVSIIGKKVFVPLAAGAAVASIGVFVSGIVETGEVTGGLIFEHNYDIVVGYVLLGTALFIHKYQWILASLALVAMFISGSPEGVFSVVALGIIVVARQDYSRKLVYALIPVVIVAVVWFSAGWGQELYGYAIRILTNEQTLVNHTGTDNVTTVGYRIEVIKDSTSGIKPLGDGFQLLNFKPDTVHNVPMIIVQQLGIPGIIAGIAWLWIIVYGIAKTKYKYVFGLLLSLSVFDHFVWTQMAPILWMVCGILNNRKDDTDNRADNGMIFKKDEQAGIGRLR